MEAQLASQGAQYHAKGFVMATIGKHPQYVAIALAVLVIVIIVLSVLLARRGKEKMTVYIPRLMNESNLVRAGNNPYPFLGAMDAGDGGSVTRAPTVRNMKTVDGATNRGQRIYLSGGLADVTFDGKPLPSTIALSSQRQNMTNKQGMEDCPEGTVNGPDGGCIPQGLIAMECAASPDEWDPEAVLQAQALAENLAVGYPPLLAGTDVNTQRVCAGDNGALNPNEMTYLTAGNGGF